MFVFFFISFSFFFFLFVCFLMGVNGEVLTTNKCLFFP